MLWHNHTSMCLLIWTVFSGEWCGPWASCCKMVICPTPNFCLLWHWRIFGTWVYRHKTFCHIHADPNTTLTFDLKDKFIGFWQGSGQSFFRPFTYCSHCIFVCLFLVFHSTKELWTCIETSLLPMKGCKFSYLYSALMAIE